MTLFVYVGRDPRGELVNGRLEADASGQIADQLLTMGITPVRIDPSLNQSGLTWRSLVPRRKDRVARTDLVLLFKQLYTLSRAGVPILRALAGLQESAANKVLSRIIDDMRVSLDSGRELSAAMGRHPEVFTPFHVNMVRVGEMTGRLEEIFLRLAEHLDFEEEMSRRVKQATRYPTFVVVAIAIAIAIANLFIIPTFAKMYESMGSALPVLTRVLIGFSNFTVNYWWLVAGAGVFGWVSFKQWLATTAGRASWDRIKLDLPIAGPILRQATVARLARSLSLSLRSGVPLVQAMVTVADVVDNSYVGKKVLAMSVGVQRGESVLGTAAASGVFSPVALQMIAVGDETGALDDLMGEVATMYERDVEYAVKGLSAQIEPILIVFMAAFVLVLALGILSPMWGLHKAALKG